MTEINKNDLKIFMQVLFSNCSGFIALRAFPEGSGNENCNSKPYNIWLNADELVDELGTELSISDKLLSKTIDFANYANKAHLGCFVIPGTVNFIGQASAKHVKEMQTLLIDIDVGDTEHKLSVLTKALGPPTMIVESGGIISGITDNQQEAVYKKLHIYWQLAKSVTGKQLEQLLELRHHIALAAGGDRHFKSAHQPIRIAGSIYHKAGANRLVKIRSYQPIKYEFEELRQSVEKLAIDDSKQNSFGNNNSSRQSRIQVHTQNKGKKSFFETLLSKVCSGGAGEETRFSSLQRVVGFWLKRHHDGQISKDEAWQEITAYNQANISPPWPEEKLRRLTNDLWNKHVQDNEPSNNESVIINSYSLGEYLGDNSNLPEDLIAPRILTPGGIFVFGGAPKVGKSDFLLSLFTNMAAGKDFLSFKPPRPLRIFYFQAEIGYYYLRERLQNMQLSTEFLNLAKENLYITPNNNMTLNKMVVDNLAEHILQKFPEGPDIIAVDPIRNVFDGGSEGATENENDAMLFFLQHRIEALRMAVNPNAGIILVHHTKKLSKKQFDEEPFNAFSGASSLRSYYSTGAILKMSELNNEERELVFELRNGTAIKPKTLIKQANKWSEEEEVTARIAYKTQGAMFDRERERRVKVIIDLLKSEARKNKFYLMKQFAEKFQNCKQLGGMRAIYNDCSAAATKGLIKFFNNPKIYDLDLNLPGNRSLGFMCCNNMKTKQNKIILPTHYKRDSDGKKEVVAKLKL